MWGRPSACADAPPHAGMAPDSSVAHQVCLATACPAGATCSMPAFLNVGQIEQASARPSTQTDQTPHLCLQSLRTLTQTCSMHACACEQVRQVEADDPGTQPAPLPAPSHDADGHHRHLLLLPRRHRDAAVVLHLPDGRRKRGDLRGVQADAGVDGKGVKVWGMVGVPSEGVDVHGVGDQKAAVACLVRTAGRRLTLIAALLQCVHPDRHCPQQLFQPCSHTAHPHLAGHLLGLGL
eukprot:353769-Chlamydomonas_euryale.AAC.5